MPATPRSRAELLAVVVVLASSVVACGPPAHVAELRAVGVRVQELGGWWYRFTTDEGVRFRMPGVPLCARESYRFGLADVGALFCDLAAEANSRAYLIHVFDARELDDAQREELREQLETQVVEAGEEASEVHVIAHRGVPAHDLVVTNMTANGHFGLVRTLIYEQYVFQLVTLVPTATGGPSDARVFFDSVEVRPELASASSGSR